LGATFEMSQQVRTYKIKGTNQTVKGAGRWQAYQQALGLGLTKIVLVRVEQ